MPVCQVFPISPSPYLKQCPPGWQIYSPTLNFFSPGAGLSLLYAPSCPFLYSPAILVAWLLWYTLYSFGHLFTQATPLVRYPLSPLPSRLSSHGILAHGHEHLEVSRFSQMPLSLAVVYPWSTVNVLFPQPSIHVFPLFYFFHLSGADTTHILSL